MGNDYYEKFEKKAELHRKWLGQLQDFYAEYRYIPTYEYLRGLLQISSKNLVSKLLYVLKDDGFLRIGPDGNWAPDDRFFELPYFDGPIQAGEFTDQHAQSSGYITLLNILIRKPSITRIRPIEGNSMINKGILDGDMAIYEQRQNAKKGDLVMAVLEGTDEVTLKELGSENGKPILIPHNDNFQIIRNKPFHIGGVLWTSYRTYG